MTAPSWSVLAGILRDERRSIALWCLAVGAVAAMYTAFYPSVGGAKMDAMLEALPPEMIAAMGFENLATAAGYVSSTVYGLLGAILTLVCATALGARLLAGAEEGGLLELEVTAPVSRGRLYAERLLALWVLVAAVVVTVGVVLLAMSVVLDLGLSPANLAAVSLGLALFAGGLGTLALAVGAATGRRSWALGVTAGVAVLAYVLAYVAPLVEGAGALADVSPYHWYIGAEPLSTGLDLAGLGLLAALALVSAGFGLVGFVRRDLAV